ncbi:tRNA pseudouridine(55) synthase TruB [Spirosoma utsteinense]|uniref:tRNA pseudouridine synthase B n=1 Tax=Spirosoma utsteinense TaxID=2585773 RepID=A0ABR6W2N1_9BACT|nr:tRNA pseudouridine(55) synthase TruB [Spirosoma utsteinense]MBC3785999.1 tRNA pseudouridine55 synthase [Spirosoma utsteinense]MBC3790697.1 tRNA pseudouridine55 synthase [Spirosoma utsteinense]
MEQPKKPVDAGQPDPGQLILIDKPLTWTSFDVANKLKYACKFKKIGHAGTLDPLATGLLILCTGKMTKQIDQYQAQEKEYTGTLVLGKTTPSVDLETEFDSESDPAGITADQIQDAARQLTGDIMQIPPIYSAVRVNGERLYEKARRGETIDIKSRQVTVSVFETDSRRFPEVDFRIVCSKGTYIRSLVRDLGLLLNNGAYMSALRRTRIGDFRVDDADTLDNFITKCRENRDKQLADEVRPVESELPASDTLL